MPEWFLYNRQSFALIVFLESLRISVDESRVCSFFWIIMAGHVLASYVLLTSQITERGQTLKSDRL